MSNRQITPLPKRTYRELIADLRELNDPLADQLADAIINTGVSLDLLYTIDKASFGPAPGRRVVVESYNPNPSEETP